MGLRNLNPEGVRIRVSKPSLVGAWGWADQALSGCGTAAAAQDDSSCGSSATKLDILRGQPLELTLHGYLSASGRPTNPPSAITLCRLLQSIRPTVFGSNQWKHSSFTTTRARRGKQVERSFLRILARHGRW